MSSPSSEPTLYEILEVSEDATLAQIQSAYFRLVRACRINEEPEHYQKLNHAREVLIDPRRRGEYDQNRKNGSRIRVLLDQAALTIDRDPQKARALLKSAVTLAPDMIRPRLLLSQLLMRTKDYPLAERQYLWILERTPNDEPLRCKLARCLMLQGRYQECEAELQKVLTLNPVYYDAQVMLARLYRTMGRTTELIATLEATILNDDVENFGDFNSLLQLLLVYIQQENNELIEQTMLRIEAVVPLTHVPMVIETFLRTADYFAQEEYYRCAAALLEQAGFLPLDDDGPQRKALNDKIGKLNLSQEALQLDGDNLLTGPLQDCFRVLYRDKSSASIRESRMDKAFAQLQHEFEAQPRELLRQLDYLHREYPLLSKDQAAFLGLLRQRSLRRIEQLQQIASAAKPRTMTPAPSVAEEPRRTGIFGRLLGAR